MISNSTNLLVTVNKLLEEATESVESNPMFAQSNMIRAHNLLLLSPNTWRAGYNWKEARKIYDDKIKDLHPKLESSLTPAKLFFGKEHHNPW